MNAPIENYPTIRWWMRKRRLSYLSMGLYTFLIITIVFVALTFVGFDKFKTKDLIFGILTFLIFVAFGLYELFCFFKSFSWKVSAYWEGTVKDKLQTKLPNRHVKDSIIIADVNGTTMNGICLPQTYGQAKKGDRILLFAIGSDKIYCVHKA